MQQKFAFRKKESTEKKSGFEFSAAAWRVLGALWLVVLLVVAVPSVGASIINASMMVDLKMERGVFGLGFGIFVLMMGLPGPAVAIGVQRWGYRRIATLGCLLLLAGSVAMATLVSTGWHYAIAFGLLVGGAVACAGMLPAQTVVARWFLVRRALAVSVVLSAIEIGGLISPPLLERMLATYDNDWRIGWWAIAGLGLTALCVVRLLLDERRVDALAAANPTPFMDTEEKKNGKVYKSTTRYTLRQAARTRAYWMIFAYMCVTGIAWVFLMAHGVVHLQDRGYAPSHVALTVVMIVTASFIGNMSAGVLGDRISPHLIAAVATILMAIGLCAAIHPTGAQGLLLYAIPTGLGYGATQVCVMTLLGNYFDKDSFSAIFGSIMPPSTICAAAGSAIAGVVFDRSGSYEPVILILIGLCVLASVAAMLASPPKTHQQGRFHLAQGSKAIETTKH